MTTFLCENDEYFSQLDTPVETSLSNPSPLANSTGTNPSPLGATESYGGVPFGTYGEVSMDINVVVTPAELVEAYGTAIAIPVSLENGCITNFQILKGGDMATDANIPKIPVKAMMEQVSTNVPNRPLLLECTSYAATPDEKFKQVHSAGAEALLGLVMSLKEKSSMDRLATLSPTVLGYAHEYGATAKSMAKTYWQSPVDPKDVILNVHTIQPYLADYNKHSDVTGGHLKAITVTDIKIAREQNNGIISRPGAFELINTLATNAASVTETDVPFALESDLSKSEFRILLGGVPRFDPALKKRVPIALTFDSYHLSSPKGAKLSQEKIEKLNEEAIHISFRLTTGFLAFLRK